MNAWKHGKSIFLVTIILLAAARLSGQEKLDLLGYRLAYHWDSTLPYNYTFGPAKFNEVWGWTDTNGREYAILGSLGATFFFDITNPDSVRLVDIEQGRFNDCIHRDFKTYRHYCYGVADEGNSSLQIFDLSYLPDSVHKVYDSNAICRRSHNIFIDTSSGLLYFAIPKYSGGWASVAVASLDTPQRPRLIKYHSSAVFGGGRAHDIFVYRDTAFLSLEGKGLGVYDFRQPDSPVQIATISSYPGKGYNHSSWTSPRRRLLVFADETHGTPLKLYDYSNPQAPVLRSTFGMNDSLGSIPHNPFVVDDTLVWVSYYYDGVVAFDISDPNHPRVVFHYDTYPDNDTGAGGTTYPINYEGCWGVYPFFPSGTVVASDRKYGLFVFVPDTALITGMRPSQAGLLSLDVHPNPAAEQVRIAFPSDRPLPRRPLVIYDAQGRTLYEEKPAARHEVTVSVAHWPPGRYLVRWGKGVAVFQKAR